MIDRYLAVIENSFDDVKPYWVQYVSSYIFDYIVEANDYVEMILSADKFAAAKTNGSFNKEYYKLLWFKTKYVTLNEINSGALCLSSLIYTAWVDAGKPILDN
jgi:hypothetical protein